MAKEKRSPSIKNILLECRVGIEGWGLLAAWPLLLRATPGEGRPVLVVPGFTTSDNATYVLRHYLEKLGYKAYGWGLGTNDGMSQENFMHLQARLDEIHRETGEKVAIVGWNLGGFYARALANTQLSKVSTVITLGTPFAMPSIKGINRVINRLYGHLNPYQEGEGVFDTMDWWERTPSVPSTSIYSKSDGVTDWKMCLEDEAPLSENVRVRGSHCGMVINPMVFHVIADRLGQAEGNWRPFSRENHAWPELAGLIKH